MAAIEDWEIVIRLLVGAALAGSIGLEREFAGQDAGFRTHLLLGLGASLFGAVSVAGFDDFVGDGAPSNVTIDVTRIASYVAPGVGFIGGGAILKHRGTVRGITTATSLWAAAAIGLASGLGFWTGAVASTVVALVALAALKPLSDWIGRRRNPPRTLVVRLGGDAGPTEVLEVIDEAGHPAVKMIRVLPGDGEATELALEFWSRPDGSTVARITSLLGERFGEAIEYVELTD